MEITVPRILKDLIDRINANRGLGLTGLIAHWELFSRAGDLVGKDGFLGSLAKLVEEHEALPVVGVPAAKPKTQDMKCERIRQLWEKRLSTFLGFAITVPLPPALNRKQMRLLARYGFLVLFIPAVAESRLPAHAVKPDWGRVLRGPIDLDSVERTPLAGRWVAVETIAKSKYGDGAYQNDLLMTDIGVTSRFNHPHGDMGGGDSIVDDLLPKVAGKVGFASPSVILPSAEEWRFVANLFNWMRETLKMPLPDLGSTDAWECCRNVCGRGHLVAGGTGVGSLSILSDYWDDGRDCSVAFRVLLVLG